MTALPTANQARGSGAGAHTDDGITIAHLLEQHALAHPDRRAFSFLGDGDGDGVSTRTWSELAAGARAVAVELKRLARTGEQPRALLLLPQDTTFLDALFGCLSAGVCAVPAHVPIPSRLAQALPRLRSIAADARPHVLLTTRELLAARDLVPELAQVPCVAIDEVSTTHAPAEPLTVAPEDLAILQYSSGSSGVPRGVMVTHANLIANEVMIRDAFGHGPSTVVLGWLPFQHDMGLIGNVLQPAFAGFECVIMTPLQFLKHPLRWLREVTRYRANTSGGPNFAFEMCVAAVARHGDKALAGLDLSSWNLAFVGAEPVRAATLDRFAATFAEVGFRREAFYPCYGLAEATLIVSGGQHGKPSPVWRDPSGRARVSCGHARSGLQLAVVDNDNGVRCDDGVEGEIWVTGASVARGYFGREQASRETFGAEFDGGTWLRTGDLGCVVDGELYITGRAKDVVVKNGVNYAAEDLEHTVDELRLPPLHPSGCAAFGYDDGTHERLVIVTEIARDAVAAWNDVADQVVAAIAAAHGTPPDAVMFVHRGSIPRTTSGKIRRSECRAHYARDELAEVHHHLTAATP
ncbi:fatty acyl-AMP ligase [Candidatus Mycobacterium methanotrophicum]|uniref:Fatty acyl-AMP ligase n=1 Tax=Candidatus Mycobacterium methanotrophicum TaxID=2943498 RepID=A0ABY4QQH4_9MYCO|nr:fatty acyl-AMP ligase [Candidatus Mycobacterium methanotrophicum]UQX12211.1 fatty acyl-AMP ligase [Candidatus Mycobacterium methanotrophicum]